jgi:hypothetical protein
MAGGGGRLDGKGLKMIGKIEQREKKGSKNNVIIGNRGNKRKYREGGGRMVTKGDRGEIERKGSI